MLLPREPLRDRLARRMTERKAAKMAKPRARVRLDKHEEDALARTDARVVIDELQAIDAHAAVLKKQIEKRPGGPAVFGLDERTHEIEIELRELAALRNEIARDDIPPMRFPSGEPLTDRQRSFRLMRSKELKEQIWKQAEMAARVGDHRRARRCRLDALRARHLAEHEMKLRTSLRGYTHAG